MTSTTAPGLRRSGELFTEGKDDGGETGATHPERHDSKVDIETASLEAESGNGKAAAQNATLPGINTPSIAHRPRASISGIAGLHLKTNLQAPGQIYPPRVQEPPSIYETPAAAARSLQPLMSSPTAPFPILGSSLRSTMSSSSMASSISPSSYVTSPFLAAMSDLTPLPSPIVGGDLSAMHRKAFDRPSTPSRSRTGSLDESFSMGRMPSQKRKKGYSSLLQGAVEASMSSQTPMEQNAQTHRRAHSRNRSISEFKPEALHNVRPRNVTLGGGKPDAESQDHPMQREVNVAAQRGVTASAPLAPETDDKLQVPTPPASSSSALSDDADDDQVAREDDTSASYLEISCSIKNKRRKFRQLRQLGEGTFSKVMLATRQRLPTHPTPEIESYLDPHKLVAVKILEHGPAGGADEGRIEISLQREVEMLKSISHASLVHLKACEYQSTRTLLVLTYCPGGDLFEFATNHRDTITPPLIQRMAAELVSAVRYLHQHWIVHRDIKLENVLVNLPTANLQALTSPQTHPNAIVTLTDLGLSRRIPDPPESPLLQTRCGSEDYAAPEILLGQPYDGRSTDAWALGVLIYALMEGRLPFDTPPGKPERSRNTHRIARCDWIWCRFGDEDGDWNGPAEFEGARDVVEGLLKKVRMGRKTLEQVESMEWVRAGIQVPGGLKVREEDEDDCL